MNKFLLLSATVLFAVSSSTASLMSVTLAGNVTDCSPTTFEIGSPVEYTFLFDTERFGTITYPTSVDTMSIEDQFFFAELQNVYALPDNYTDPIVALNFGFNFIGNDYSGLIGGFNYHQVSLYSYTPLDMWQVGTDFLGEELAYSPINGSDYALSNLRITGLSEGTANVPEPSVFMMMLAGLGLLGVNSIRRTGRRK